MHIPDGYLSPQTCLVLAGAAAPVCRHALQRVRRETGDRGVPALALGAAFAFTVQMLNVRTGRRLTPRGRRWRRWRWGRGRLPWPSR